MKSKKVLAFVVTASIVLLFSVSGLAMAGGVPSLHDLSGEAFGKAVSEQAQSEPGAVAAHVADKTDRQPIDSGELEMDADATAEAGSMPAAHGLTGEEFGEAVSKLANDDPASLAEHVRPAR